MVVARIVIVLPGLVVARGLPEVVVADRAGTVPILAVGRDGNLDALGVAIVGVGLMTAEANAGDGLRNASRSPDSLDACRALLLTHAKGKEHFRWGLHPKSILRRLLAPLLAVLPSRITSPS